MTTASARTGTATLPRLLAGCRSTGSSDLDHHHRVYGEMPRRPDPRALLGAVQRSGLRGRGGAGFPTGRKLEAVAAGRRPVVVANGAEGEPASAKDRLLLEALPHLVLDGAVLAAIAVGAREVLVCVPRTAIATTAALTRALAEREARRLDPVRLDLVPVADRYISGEESALVNQLNDGPAVPTTVPPRPFERGVRRRPTLIQNAETLAHIATIARYGPDWLRQTGTASDPGSSLVTVSGSVRVPLVIEVSLGSPLRRALDQVDMSHEPRAALIGGYFGAWVDLDGEAAIPLTHDGKHGAPLGCGVVGLLPRGACGFCQTARLLDYLAGESAEQCGPCVFGLRAIADAAELLGAGHGDHRTVAQLIRWSNQVEGRGACRHPDGAVRLLRSALAVFADDVQRHMAGGACVGRGSWLPLPSLTARRAA